MENERKGITFTSNELLRLKKIYDNPDKFEEFFKNYTDNMDKYKDFGKFMFDSYLGDFMNTITQKIITHGEVEITCESRQKPNGEEYSFCTVMKEGKLPMNIGYEIPKEMFKDFVMLAIAPLTEEEIKQIRVVRLNI